VLLKSIGTAAVDRAAVPSAVIRVAAGRAQWQTAVSTRITSTVVIGVGSVAMKSGPAEHNSADEQKDFLWADMERALRSDGMWLE